jgi:hypothetical protein
VTDYSPLTKTKIEDFQIWNMNKPVGDLAFLGGMVSLKKLKLWSLQDLTNFAALVSLSNLETLIIDAVNAKSGAPVDLAFVAKLPKLTSLDLSKSKIASLDGVAGSATLEQVNLADVVGVTSLDPLKKLSKLKSIRVTKDAFTPEQLAGFPDSVKISQ